MQEFNHIESIWARHQVDIKISATEMLKQVKKEVGGIRTRGMLNIVGMILSFLSLSALWIAFDFNSLYTHLGISIIILSIIAVTLVLYNNHRIISKTDFTVNPTEFIARLKEYEVNQHAIYHKLYWFDVIALTVGMALSFWEILAGFDFWVQALIVFLSIDWIIFCSTILRKAIIKRDKERINLLIEKFTRISEQF